MKTKCLIWLMTMGFALMSFSLFAQFSGGTGTEADPYQVANATDLNNVRNYLDSHFIQTADIDLGVAPWNEGEGWVPIGTGSSFSGLYNGNEYKIINLYINRPGSAYNGLFYVLDNSEIISLNLEDVQIIGGDFTGALAGIGRNWLNVRNCITSGSVTGNNITGGFIGQLLMVSEIWDSVFMGSVTGANSVGGFVGDSFSNNHAWNQIFTSVSDCIVTGNDHVGGFIGSMGIRNSIVKCLNMSQVNGSNFIGGFGGSGYHFNIVDSYNNGNVSGNSIVGGLVGGPNGAFSCTFYRCYSIGQVIGVTETGGLLGRGGGIASLNSYWNTETSGISSSAVGEGMTTASMTYPYSTNSYVTWDFETIWHADPDNLNNGYPYLNEDWLPVIRPRPNFTVSSHSGQVPLTVSFVDASIPAGEPITSYAWDFDNDGTVDSNLQNPSWTYTQPGNYSVTLTVSDGTNTVSKTKENIVHVEHSSLGDGLVGYYPFTGNANDFSGLGNDGTTFNTTLTTDRFGRENSAYYFGGDGDYISIPETFLLHQPGDASFSFWMKKKDNGARGIFWTRGNSDDTNRFNIFCGDDGQGFEIDYRDPNGTLRLNYAEHDVQIPNEFWTNIVVVRSGNVYRIYSNGELSAVKTDEDPYLPTTVGTWGIGNWNGGFYGLLDDIRFYNRAISDLEIQRLYAMDTQSVAPICRFSATPTTGVRPLQVQFTDESIQSMNPITSWAWDFNNDGEIDSNLQNPLWIYPNTGTYTVSLTVSDGTYNGTITKQDYIVVNAHQTNNMISNGLMGYWPFNGNTEDVSGNERHGTIVGQCHYTEDRYGNPQGAIANNGSPNYVSLPYFPIGSGPVTISCWYKTNASVSDDHNAILSIYGNSTEVDYRIFQSGFNIGIARHAPGYTWNDTSTTPISAGVWYNPVIVYDGGTLHFYLNGNLIQSIGSGYSGWAGTASGFRIGCGAVNPESFTNGFYDDVSIFNRAFTGTEIAELFAVNTNPSIDIYGIHSPAVNDRWLVGSYQEIEWVIPDTLSSITMEYSTDSGSSWIEIANSIPAHLYSYTWMIPDTASDNCKVRIKDRTTPTVLYESEVFSIYRPSILNELGLVAYYPLDGNTNDYSDNANHGINYGGVFAEDRFGNTGSAVSFDGTSYIHCNLENGGMLDTSTTGAKTTVAFWMKWDGTDDCMPLGWYDYDLWFRNGRFGFNTGQGDCYSISSAIMINTWVHVVAEFTNNGTYSNRLFFNGELQSLASHFASSLSKSIRNQARISGWLLDDNYGFHGSIDELLVYNRQLNNDEIQQLYTGYVPHNSLVLITPSANSSLVSGSTEDIFWYADSGIDTVDIDFSSDNGDTWESIASALPAQQYHFAWNVPQISALNCKLRIVANTEATLYRNFSIVSNPMDAGLIAYYPMDGDATDASGNGRHGTVNGLVSATDRFGVDDSGMRIDDKSDFVSIPNVSGSNISVSMWYYFEGTGGNWNTLLCSATDRHSLLIQPSNNQLGFWHSGFYPSTFIMNLNNWHHIVVSQTGLNYKLYVNDSLVLTSANSFDNALYPLNMIGNYVRYWEDNQGSLGIIDDLRIYNRELSPQEVSALYDNGARVNLSGRVVGSDNPEQGLSGVSVVLGEGLASTQSDGNGYFYFNAVEANRSYRLSFSQAAYADLEQMVDVLNFNQNLGTITLFENSHSISSLTVTQTSNASQAVLSWQNSAGRAFVNYSVYRLRSGEENNPSAWNLLSEVTANSYTDTAWYGIAFGIYRYAVAPNYSGDFQDELIFSDPIQRRNFDYSQDFNQNGATPEGWTILHSGTTAHPWMIVNETGQNFRYRVSNTSLATANETLRSPTYDCSRYDKVLVNFWHNYAPNINSQARFQYSLNGITWTTLMTLTNTADSGVKSYDISSAAHHQAGVRLRWLYTATSYNANSWTIDDVSVQGYSHIPVYLANPYPLDIEVNSREVELGISFIDDEMVNAATLAYRIDANGNGVYDASEAWIPIAGYSNAETIDARVTATFQIDAEILRYEFKGQDLAGNTIGYSGSNRSNGIGDDYYVSIDTIAPTAVQGFSLSEAGFQSASLSWQAVTEAHFQAYEIYYSPLSNVGLDSPRWSVAQDHLLAEIACIGTTINNLAIGSKYYFRIRAIDTHGNASELTEPLPYVSADLAPVASNPIPSGQPISAWQNSRIVNIGLTYSDYYGMDLSTVQYRYDRNGNGRYDASESWQNVFVEEDRAVSSRNPAKRSKAKISVHQMDNDIRGLSEDELEQYCFSRNQLSIAVPVEFDVDGKVLKYEFRASDIHGVGPVYTGFYGQSGIDDDWFVRIDTIAPQAISDIYSGFVGENSVDIAWTASADANFYSYEVYYGNHPDIDITDLKWDFANDINLAYAGSDIIVSTVSPEEAIGTLYFAVRAVDMAGNASPLSNVVLAYFGGDPNPAKVQNLQVQISGDDVILSWDAVTTDTEGNPLTPAGYRIYASDSPNLVVDIGYLIDECSGNEYIHAGIAPFIDKIFYIVTAVAGGEVRRFEKPQDQKLRDRK